MSYEDIKWKCSFCGKTAEAHYCTQFTKGIHIYFCHNCHNQYLGYRPLINTKIKKYIKEKNAYLSHSCCSSD